MTALTEIEVVMNDRPKPDRTERERQTTQRVINT
jgi:hypothetical protein